MNGDQAYFIIADYLTGKLWHVSSVINNPPLNWLNIWIACNNTPNVHNKYVVMDQGGEMSQNPTIVSLFDKYVYAVRCTASDTSPKNYPDEGPCRYIGEAVSSLMERNQVTPKVFHIPSISILKFVVWSHMANQDYHLMNKFL